MRLFVNRAIKCCVFVGVLYDPDLIEDDRTETNVINQSTATTQQHQNSPTHTSLSYIFSFHEIRERLKPKTIENI